MSCNLTRSSVSHVLSKISHPASPLTVYLFVPCVVYEYKQRGWKDEKWCIICRASWYSWNFPLRFPRLCYWHSWGNEFSFRMHTSTTTDGVSVLVFMIWMGKTHSAASVHLFQCHLCAEYPIQIGNTASWAIDCSAFRSSGQRQQFACWGKYSTEWEMSFERYLYIMRLSSKQTDFVENYLVFFSEFQYYLLLMSFSFML